MAPAPTFMEFFAGGGMARLGLEGWRCLYANDLDPMKARAYAENFGAGHLVQADVWSLGPDSVPSPVDLAWASPPCQDLSLAGQRAGLSARRSGAFWGFHRLIKALSRQGRAPTTVVIENVTGLLTSNGGADFAALCEALADLGYRVGALEADAALWSAQSRPRVFVIATRGDPKGLTVEDPGPPFHSDRIRTAHARLGSVAKTAWVWWRLNQPTPPAQRLIDLLEPDAGRRWFTSERTDRLIAQMAPLHRERLGQALASGQRTAAAVYRRTRHEDGRRVQRAEARFDGRAGCLRTPAGGSSRQFVLVIEEGGVRARLLTAREAARLMGLPDAYRLPASEQAALKLVGDGVSPHVVAALNRDILLPLARGHGAERQAG
ncbi:DNA cytosine methyltransferase [Brevundimonas sp. 2R-24]|uniref:DNA (cytosine-5-)-methyltransferase n=1 Tax=Peiella sedimenti TaxID=3061083 RepID=A0ABT8SN60_9CAUL|nr:DNA cytosine methyltransferase [Caulobacteraceae bacterium XZ-24]